MEYKCSNCKHFVYEYARAGFKGPICLRLSKYMLGNPTISEDANSSSYGVYLLCEGENTHLRVSENFLCKLFKPLAEEI